MSTKDQLHNLDLDTRLNLCRSKENFKTTRNGPLEYYIYNLASGYLGEGDTDNPTFIKLVDNYGNQLLRPLFQDSPLYNRVNTTKEGKPKYDAGTTLAEVETYSGISGRFVDPCFILLDSADTNQRFDKLVGYTLGFGLPQQTGVIDLVTDKLWSEEDDIELHIPLTQLDDIAGMSAYFSGIGVSEEFQSKGGLGLVLMHKFLTNYQKLGYKSILTRVKRGAINWSLFAGIDDDPKAAIPGTLDVMWYSNDIEGQRYRGLFLNDIGVAMEYIEGVLARKGTHLPI